MGYAPRYTPTKEEIEENRRKFAEYERKKDEKLERLAMKCATIAIDNIITDIVRPGPKPEERECYDVANEIREYRPKIIADIKKAFKVEAADYDGVVKSEYRDKEQ